MNEISKSILKTLCYSDLFQYPLTKKQIYTYLITPRPIPMRSFEEVLKQTPYVQKKGSLFYITGRSTYVRDRLRKEQVSIKKIKKAQNISRLLAYIPTIQFIGLSGSVAVKNSQNHDDIDLFIITRQNSLWVTRFLVTVVLFLLGQKRALYASYSEDRMCTNMFMTTHSLQMPKVLRNIYTAHEIVQVVSLVNKNNTFEVFLSENKWVKRYMAHVVIPNISVTTKKNNLLLSLIDSAFYKIQYVYMQKRVTKELIMKDLAMFHPTDYEFTVPKRYKARYLSILRQIKRKSQVSSSPRVLPHGKMRLASIFTPGS